MKYHKITEIRSTGVRIGQKPLVYCTSKRLVSITIPDSERFVIEILSFHVIEL